MFDDDIEGLSDSKGLEDAFDYGGIESRDHLTDTEYNYLSEVLPYNDGELLVNRIDELGSTQPPKAIDANAEVSELLDSVKDTIDPIYLEAPNDSVQITEAAEAMFGIEGLDYDSWHSMDVSERAEVLQNLENTISAIAHRPACQLNVSKMGDKVCGYFDPDTKQLFINSDYLAQDSFAAYKENLDTIIHEGRHAYQDYNMTSRIVHPREGEVQNWLINEHKLGYLEAQKYGMELYRTQPLEADAFAFASDVIKSYFRT